MASQQQEQKTKNREAQARWRERHIYKRRMVQRIGNILLRKTLADEHYNELADAMRAFMPTSAIAKLRRALKPITDKENAANLREGEKAWRELWLREHPDRTAAEYRRLLRNDTSEVWDWRRAKGAASIEAERQAWERDHPGQKWSEHLCGLPDREYTDYARWQRQRARKRKPKPVKANAAITM